MANEPAPEKTLTQSEVNQLMTELIQKERRRFETQLTEQKNAREKAENLLREREEELRRRDEQIRQHELRRKAQDALAARGLPATLLNVLPLGDESTLDSSIQALESAYRTSLEKGVRERLRGQDPFYAPPVPEKITKPTLNYQQAAALYQSDRAAYDKQYGGK